MDTTLLTLVVAGIAGMVIYGLYRLCVGTVDEQVNPALAARIDHALGMTDKEFRRTNAYFQAKMLDPDVEYCTVMLPEDVEGFFKKKTSN